MEVYALALPEGEGAAIPLSQWGEIGFRNDGGHLVLTVPQMMASWVQHKLGAAVIHGPSRALSQDGTAYVSEFRIRLQPGMRAGFPLGALGEFGVEAG